MYVSMPTQLSAIHVCLYAHTVVVSALNCYSVKLAAKTHVLASTGKVLALVMIIIGGIVVICQGQLSAYHIVVICQGQLSAYHIVVICQGQLSAYHIVVICQGQLSYHNLAPKCNFCPYLALLAYIYHYLPMLGCI